MLSGELVFRLACVLYGAAAYVANCMCLVCLEKYEVSPNI